jgi:hypothetical protein
VRHNARRGTGAVPPKNRKARNKPYELYNSCADETLLLQIALFDIAFKAIKKTKHTIKCI